MNKITPLPIKDVVIEDAFWSETIRTVRKKVIPYQWEALNDRVPEAAKSHCVKNFEIAAGRREGEFYGMVFQDSDLYKWLETVAYSLETKPDAELERLADSAIELIGAAQGQDGYVNTYYTIKEPQGRWGNLAQGHELYCAGHMIEAAVAYFSATGKRSLLDIAIRFADCIDKTFGPQPGKRKGYPGHQEIELALVRLHEVTGERRYIELADYFIRERGKAPSFFEEEKASAGYKTIFPEIEPLPRGYSQSHMPPVEQRQATGHAVRAVYMYSAMADLAAKPGNSDLRQACNALFEDIANRQMYVTGAIGATATGESFTGGYDLPNDTMYGETCASVGLMMFARRMNALTGEARYADVMELALYNRVLGGISLSGTEFFYANPQECEPERIAKNPELSHIKTVRQKWFDCSCCPTNIARTIMGLGAYAYGLSEDGLYMNLYVGGKAKAKNLTLEVKTSYPYGEEATIIVRGGRGRLYLRNPESSPVKALELNGEALPIKAENGYIVLERDWNGEKLRLAFDMTPRLIYSSPKAQGNVGKAAVKRGPLVYCAEDMDNESTLGRILLPQGVKFSLGPAPKGLPKNTVTLEAPVYRYFYSSGKLHTAEPPGFLGAAVALIPYFLWGNRGENEMRVYFNVAPLLPGSR